METPDYQFEICANSVESCLAAQAGGAHRVELCSGIPEGGTTPSIGDIRVARRLLDIKLYVIIRPRGGDFLYTSLELETMMENIKVARQEGADGLVTGCLTPEGEVDIPAMKRIMEVADGCPVTFHRAFDHCADPFRTLEDLIGLGVKRILTSGQQPTAPQGAELIRQLIMQANDRITIMPGCGINENNIHRLAQHTGAREFHFSAREKKASLMRPANPLVRMGNAGIDDSVYMVTTSERVSHTISALLHPPVL